MDEITIINYNPIECIVEFIVNKFLDGTKSIDFKLTDDQMKKIAGMHHMTDVEVAIRIYDDLASYCLNENGDTLTGQWDETPDGYVLHVKLDDEDEDD